ncbi:hypothetical protein HYW17_05890 [Candidatus Uhrbacteria bacterium]|nr:hypothetical protein [Candidatus Uhrbacteria bacterium]
MRKSSLRAVFFGIALAVIFSIARASFAAPPSILSYQGRLTDAGGTLLGSSSGTTYYFRFSIWSDAAGGTQLWPSGTPATVGLTVQSGVFNALIGDTAAGFDALNLDFHTDPSIYLQIGISPNVDFSSSETLTPRQRIVSSGFAINADTVDGAHAGTSANNVLQLNSAGGIDIASFFNLQGMSAPAVSASGQGKIYFDSTTNRFRVSEHAGAYANLVGGSGSSAWDDLTAPDAALSLAMAEYATTFSWNTGATAAAFDGLTLSLTNDASTDATTQRGLVIKNESATGGTTERLVVLENADDSTLTTALEILGSSTGAITTGLDVSDAQLTNAFSIGGNFALFDGVRIFEGATGTLTIEDTSGNDLMTIVDAGTTGNLTVTGAITISGGTINNASVGATTASSGAFTTLSSTGATTLGNDSATVAIDSSDWNISTDGAATGIGAITADGLLTVSLAGNTAVLTNTTDNAAVQAAILQGDRATMADNDEAYLTLRLSNDAGTQTEFGRLTWVATDVNAATSVDGRLDFGVVTAGTLADELQLDGTALSPSTSDGSALGTTSLMWGDLFLASGGVINFDNGDVTLTHAGHY